MNSKTNLSSLTKIRRELEKEDRDGYRVKDRKGNRYELRIYPTILKWKLVNNDEKHNYPLIETLFIVPYWENMEHTAVELSIKEHPTDDGVIKMVGSLEDTPKNAEEYLELAKQIIQSFQTEEGSTQIKSDMLKLR